MKVNSITLGGIFAACYAILTAIFIYVLPILSSFSMIVLPIIAAYYATKYKLKETILFDIATIFVCFLVGIGDPFYCILYVLPSLIIGNIFGLLNHLKIKFYSTIFFQSLVFSILNYVTLILAEIFYETSIIRFIILDENILLNYSLCILFIISLAEAIMCTLFVSGELKKLGVYKDIEEEFPNYGYIAIIILVVLSIIAYFVNNNFYHLFTFLTLILEILSLIKLLNSLKYKMIAIALTSIFLVVLCLLLSSLNLEKLIMLSITIILAIISLLSYILAKHTIEKK